MTNLQSHAFSHNIRFIFSNLLLALQLLPLGLRLLHMGNVALPRPCSRRVPRRASLLDLPRLRDRPRIGRIRKRAVDVCGRVLGYTNDLESVLALCVPLHRLPGTRALN